MSLKYSLTTLTAALAMIFLSSCATAIKGTTQEVSVNSSPAGAEVLIDGKLAGVTPLKVAVSRKSGAQVVVQKKGFTSQTGYFRTAPNEQASNFIRFRKDEDSGANNNVVPQALDFNLLPAFLPKKRAGKPVGDKTEMLEKAKMMHASGEASETDYLYMVQAIEFYYAN